MPSSSPDESYSNVQAVGGYQYRSYLHVIVLIALMMGLLLRFVRISSPPYDNHSFRQTQTLFTIEDFHARGIDLLHPRTNWAGYPGTFVLEFPAFQAVAAVLYRMLGPHLEIVRLINILLGSATAWLLYRITARLLDSRIAWLTVIIYWLSPLNIIYQRSVLIDPMAVFCGMLSFHQLVLMLRPRNSDTQPGALVAHKLQFVVFIIATCLTALIKALYLWPAVLFLGQQLVGRRFRLDARMVLVLAVFAVAGACFLTWNAHAARVNNASPFTRGTDPISHLGLSALLDPHFYFNHLIRRPKWWLGVLGAVLYPVGLLAAWKERDHQLQAGPLLLLFLIPPSYLILFAGINHPHDYYQLIITPFLAIASAYGVQWLADRLQAARPEFSSIRRAALAVAGGVFILASAFAYLKWMKLPKLDPTVVKFEQFCAGKFDPGSSAMLFAASDVVNSVPDHHIPQYLYAAKLWGCGRAVEETEGGRNYYERFAPSFTNLQYVVFYGTHYPDWMTNRTFETAIRDVENRFYIFRQKPILSLQK